MDHTIQDNISVLKQGLDLLGKIEPQDYTKHCPQCFDSNIGDTSAITLNTIKIFSRAIRKVL